MSARSIGARRRPLPSRWRKLVAPGAVLIGGFAGSGARAGIGSMFPVEPGQFPATTLLVNIVGSLLLGLFLARRQRAITRRWSLHLWAIGALGSFTTFSTFSVEVFRLIDTGEIPLAVLYVVASILLGLGAALLGQRLGRAGR